jgi:hypothetical protein
VTPQEIQKAAGLAGFKQVRLDDSIRTIFTRGQSTLIVHKRCKWAVYTSVCGGKQPAFGGDNLKSLLIFLMSECFAANTKADSVHQ